MGVKLQDFRGAGEKSVYDSDAGKQGAASCSREALHVRHSRTREALNRRVNYNSAVQQGAVHCSKDNPDV